MKISVLGKRGSLLNWTESAVAAWRQAGHTVQLSVFREPRINPKLEHLLFSPAIGAPRAAAIARRVRAFAPDVIVAISAFDTPLSLLHKLARTPGLPPLFGWVGDLFGAEAADKARYFACVGYSDTGFVTLHRKLGLAGEPMFLPHAANPGFAAQPPPVGPRDHRLLFVASPSPVRRQIVAAISQPVVLYGGGWGDGPPGIHEVHAKPPRIAIEVVGELYRRYAAVLNIRNERNVLTGLNQRSFDPYLCGAAVVSDAQSDLEHCFDPGYEVMVWRDADELNALYAQLLRDPALAASVAARGQRRVLMQHTYAARLNSIAAAMQVARAA